MHSPHVGTVIGKALGDTIVCPTCQTWWEVTDEVVDDGVCNDGWYYCPDCKKQGYCGCPEDKPRKGA